VLPLSIDRAQSSHLAAGPVLPAHRSRMALADAQERHAFGVWAAVLVGLCVFVALGHVWLRLKVAEVGYRFEATQQAVERLRVESRELVTEAARFDNAVSLELLANSRLGLQRPGKGQAAVLP
jgi:hypothetical protein